MADPLEIARMLLDMKFEPSSRALMSCIADLVDEVTRLRAEVAEKRAGDEPEPSGLARLIDTKIAAALDAYRVGVPVDIVVDVAIRGRAESRVEFAPLRFVVGSDEDIETEEGTHG